MTGVVRVRHTRCEGGVGLRLGRGSSTRGERREIGDLRGPDTTMPRAHGFDNIHDQEHEVSHQDKPVEPGERLHSLVLPADALFLDCKEPRVAVEAHSASHARCVCSG